MKLLILTLLIFFNFAHSQNTDSTDFNSGFVYGENHVFIVKAPTGWVLDNTSGVNQGLHAVFYPQGGSWERSPVVMYANGIDIDSSETLENFIDGDKTKFLNDYSGIKIENVDPIHIGDRAREAQIIKFYGGSYKNFEAVAYIKEAKSISIFVITSRNENDFKSSYYKFVELVQNYVYIGDKVIIEN